MNVPLIAVGVKDGAAALGISECKLRRLISAGMVPSSRIGRRRVVKLADLELLLEAKAS